MRSSDFHEIRNTKAKRMKHFLQTTIDAYEIECLEQIDYDENEAHEIFASTEREIETHNFDKRDER